MGAKLKIAGFVAVGALAGALATMQLQAFARNRCRSTSCSNSPPSSA
jgi:hypothetical protein